jgi:uncharacterized protein YndB with AHSA1/START domain
VPEDDKHISITRYLKAPPSVVFEAWTRPELMAQWFFPAEGWRAEVTADLKAEGSYRVVMYDPGGGAHVQEGVYVEIEPLSKLVFTWTCPDLGVQDSLVTLEFAEAGGRTELTLTHRLPDDPEILREHEEGWHGCLGSLERWLG